MTDHDPDNEKPCQTCHPPLGRPVYTDRDGKCVECGVPYGSDLDYQNGQKVRLQLGRIGNLFGAYKRLRFEGSGLSGLAAQELHAATGWLVELENQRSEIAVNEAKTAARKQLQRKAEREQREHDERQVEKASQRLRRMMGQ